MLNLPLFMIIIPSASSTATTSFLEVAFPVPQTNLVTGSLNVALFEEEPKEEELLHWVL